MPSTFFAARSISMATGDVDIADLVPDALASTAKFLQNAGYRRTSPGFEVRPPAGLDTSDASRKNKRPIDARRSAGVTLADGSPLPGSHAQRGADDSGAGRARLPGRPQLRHAVQLQRE